MNGYFEEINGNKYLTLIHTNESKDKIEKYEEMWNEIRDLIRSELKNEMIMIKNLLESNFIKMISFL